MDKDLQYYLEHPDETPSDPALLEQFLVQINAEPAPAEKDVKAEDPPAEVAPSGEGEKTATDPEPKDAGGVEGTGETEAPIATRDGKRTIPYDVLKTERERRQAAETAVRQLSDRIAEVEAQLAQGTVQGDQRAAQITEAAVGDLSPDDIDALREDFPAMGGVIDKLLSKIDTLTNTVQSLSTREDSREAAARKSAAETVQDFIDNEPVLAHLQANDPKLFAKAVELDALLLGDTPDMAARFAEVATFMQMKYGPFDGVKAPAEEAPPPKETRPSVSKEAARRQVEKQVKEVVAKPRSLSDLPSGEPPATSEQAELENLSPAEIGAKLMTMSAEQRAAFLNRL